MLFAFDKLTAPLLTPLGGILALLTATIILLLLGRQRSSLLLLLVATFGLYLTSMPITARTVSGILERPFPPQPIASTPVANVIILLGGATEPAFPPRQDVELNAHADRILHAADLYKANKAAFVIVSGGDPDAYGVSEAQAMGEVLIHIGVPDTAILLEDKSVDTASNARLSETIMHERGWKTGLLVTSAVHMPRAMLSFAVDRTLSISPSSTDVIDAPHRGYPLIDWLPSATALQETGDALREMLGIAYYRFRGWS